MWVCLTYTWSKASRLGQLGQETVQPSRPGIAPRGVRHHGYLAAKEWAKEQAQQQALEYGSPAEGAAQRFGTVDNGESSAAQVHSRAEDAAHSSEPAAAAGCAPSAYPAWDASGVWWVPPLPPPPPPPPPLPAWLFSSPRLPCPAAAHGAAAWHASASLARQQALPNPAEPWAAGSEGAAVPGVSGMTGRDATGAAVQAAAENQASEPRSGRSGAPAPACMGGATGMGAPGAAVQAAARAQAVQLGDEALAELLTAWFRAGFLSGQHAARAAAVEAQMS